MTTLSPALRHASLGSSHTNAVGPTADIVARLLSEIAQSDTVKATDWRSDARANIVALLTECSERGWDGYGAAPISQAAAHYALRLVDALPVYLPEPAVVPDPDGDISFTWDFGPERLFTVSIGARATISYAGILGHGVHRHGQEPFEGDVADILIESIRQAASAGPSTG
jgi:hypothetical protein